jgi:cytochrome bd-type quinol oxidase subunit 2
MSSRSAQTSSRLRWYTGTALLVAAAAHVPVTPEHLREAPYMGWLFVGFTAVAVITAVVVAVRGTVSAPFFAAGVLCAAAILAYALTRVIAFPELGDDVGNWGEPLGVLSVASEAAVVVLSLVAAVRIRAAGSAAPSRPRRSGPVREFSATEPRG